MCTPCLHSHVMLTGPTFTPSSSLLPSSYQINTSTLTYFKLCTLQKGSVNAPDVSWPDWIHGGGGRLRCLCIFLLTFLMFSSSSCLASLAVCSSLILSSSSSCSACCFSRSSRRFCRASRCGAGRSWRSRLTQVWMAERKTRSRRKNGRTLK